MVAEEIIKLRLEEKHIFEQSISKLSRMTKYTNEDIKRVINEAFRAKLIKKEREVSLRMGLIIIFEEELQTNDFPRNYYDLEKILQKARRRFVIKQGNRNRFSSLSEAHPEDPCFTYEENARKKGQYRIILQRILNNAVWLIEVEKAEASLQKTLEDVIDC